MYIYAYRTSTKERKNFEIYLKKTKTKTNKQKKSDTVLQRNTGNFLLKFSVVVGILLSLRVTKTIAVENAFCVLEFKILLLLCNGIFEHFWKLSSTRSSIYDWYKEFERTINLRRISFSKFSKKKKERKEKKTLIFFSNISHGLLQNPSTVLSV